MGLNFILDGLTLLDPSNVVKASFVSFANPPSPHFFVCKPDSASSPNRPPKKWEIAMQREVKTRAWVLLLIFVTGCGDPTKDRLEVGQRVILVPTHADSSGKVSSESVLGRVPEGDTLLVPAGTEAKVARDDGPLDDPVRKVVLTITEGEFAGVLAEESRYALRPVK